MSHRLLSTVRVLDLSGNLAGLYAGRLLADAGATVMRPCDSSADLGDPGTGYSTTAYRALQRLLDAGKVPAPGGWDSLTGVDVVLDSGDRPAFDARAAFAEHPELVIVSITDYGLTGPLANQRASSHLRQAQSGSTCSRGVPDGPPMTALGETEQFLAGAYAAAAATAVLNGPAATGTGDLLDLSLLEVSNIGQTLFGTTQASMRDLLGEDFPRRSVQIPANERTLDGWVGLCTISARQRQDLLLMIGRPDLADDEDNAYGINNADIDTEIRRDVDAWTRGQTTADVIDLASALRIPVSPLANGQTITSNEQLVARKFFHTDDDGTLVPGPTFTFSPTHAPILRTTHPEPYPGDLPLAGVRVVDLTAWWAGPAATHLFAALGADVVKVESATHPDGMRYSFVADPTTDLWWERAPVFYAINTNKRGITLDLTSYRGREVLHDLLRNADILIENFTPRVLDSMNIDWDGLRRQNSALITVRMPAFGLNGPWRDRTGFAQTVEQASGLAWITGLPDGPPVAPRGICDPLAGIHAAFAAMAALYRQRRTGLGGTVEVSMIEPATYSVIGQSLAWQLDSERVDRVGNRHHRAAPFGVYPTAGDDDWICITVQTDDHWSGLTSILGRDDWDDARWQDVTTRVEHQDELDEVISAWAASQTSTEAVVALQDKGVPAARVDGAGRLLEHPQLAHRGYFEWVDHGIAGRHPVPGLPLRSAVHTGPWNRSAAPTLGQHTREVLGDWLNYSSEATDDLFAQGVSATRPTNVEPISEP